MLQQKLYLKTKKYINELSTDLLLYLCIILLLYYVQRENTHKKENDEHRPTPITLFTKWIKFKETKYLKKIKV